jgi:hypothetical protein
MKAPGLSTFDLDEPRRPSLDDVGGGAKEDDAEEPPDPRTMPYADEYNTFAHLLRAYGRVVATARISVQGGAAPFVSGHATPGTRLTRESFAVQHHGPGDVSITWPPKTLPTPLCAPAAWINEQGSFTIAAYAIVDGVRVLTFENDQPRDAAFTVEVT